jgi:hypothetical protein
MIPVHHVVHGELEDYGCLVDHARWVASLARSIVVDSDASAAIVLLPCWIELEWAVVTLNPMVASRPSVNWSSMPRRPGMMWLSALTDGWWRVTQRPSMESMSGLACRSALEYRFVEDGKIIFSLDTQRSGVVHLALMTCALRSEYFDLKTMGATWHRYFREVSPAGSVTRVTPARPEETSILEPRPLGMPGLLTYVARVGRAKVCTRGREISRYVGWPQYAPSDVVTQRVEE